MPICVQGCQEVGCQSPRPRGNPANPNAVIQDFDGCPKGWVPTRCSCIIHTGRAGTSGDHLFVFCMAHSSSSVEHPQKPARFSRRGCPRSRMLLGHGGQTAAPRLARWVERDGGLLLRHHQNDRFWLEYERHWLLARTSPSQNLDQAVVAAAQ